MMICVLLVCFAAQLAAVDDFACPVYSDKNKQKIRTVLVEKISRGPIKELDAYISYVCSTTYLGDVDAFTNSDVPERIFLHRSLKDQFSGLAYKEIIGGAGVRCIEKCIELGLQDLAERKLTAPELIAYTKINFMIKELAVGLSEEVQRRLWCSLIRQERDTDRKTALFDAYTLHKERARSLQKCLLTYYELIIAIIADQFYASILQ